MPNTAAAALYRGHRYPADVIAHAVWLYFRFSLSLRDVEELLAQRRVAVSYEAICTWCRTFGATYAAQLRRRRPRPGDKWHGDEVQLKINGQQVWLWRVIDQQETVLDILVQTRRDQAAAEPFLRRVLSAVGDEPRVVITDKLASYGPAVRRVLPQTEHRRHKGLNNRAENAHQPTRQRERAMRRFKSPDQAQRFLEPFGAVGDHFRAGRYRTPAPIRRRLLDDRFRTWGEATGLRAAA